MINLNNKKFILECNSDNGEISSETTFHYHQNKNIIWAEYSGGQILKGSIIGKIVENHLEFSYHHINTDYEVVTGTCKSYPEITENGKIRLKEFWQWTCKDNSKGESTLIEM